MPVLTRIDRQSWLQTVWAALEPSDPDNAGKDINWDAVDWDDVCTAMAWIAEALGQDPAAQPGADSRDDRYD